MEYTEEQLAQFGVEFAKRRRLQFICWIFFLMGTIIGATFLRRQLPIEPLCLLMLAYAAVFVFITYKNWRCPACNRYLGHNLIPTYCPRCGVELD